MYNLAEDKAFNIYPLLITWREFKKLKNKLKYIIKLNE